MPKLPLFKANSIATLIINLIAFVCTLVYIFIFPVYLINKSENMCQPINVILAIVYFVEAILICNTEIYRKTHIERQRSLIIKN